MRRIARPLLIAFASIALLASACGDDDDTNAGQGDDLPTVVVTTNILGDVVSNLVGDQANVVTIMPVGADPHDFQASAQQVDQITSAAALIVNGGNFEEGILDVIESAENDGVPTFEALSAVPTIEYGEGGHDDHGHDDHEGEEGHDDDEDHDDHEGEEGHDDDEDHDDHEGEEGHSDDEDHDDH
ncbi:MAG: zinc ABC transporter substrate-binding protein, partial [Actinomycetota bacterium]